LRNWGEATKIDRRRRGFFFSAPCFFYSPTSHKNWETERRMIGDGEVSKKKKVGLCPTTHTHTHKGRETNTYTHTYRDKCFSVTPLQQDSACGWVRGWVCFCFYQKFITHAGVFLLQPVQPDDTNLRSYHQRKTFSKVSALVHVSSSSQVSSSSHVSRLTHTCEAITSAKHSQKSSNKQKLYERKNRIEAITSAKDSQKSSI